ncbi:hypothetical protein FC89_GL000279 [Liquorilactobacillus ghanensis DSM 18630]|uniref:Uncharacterized protein n=1 Tax=Liquorilactobacillus ghanensis DSM 18630 TaxID=1423750 RepID=A0A0R1VMM0_9LACO|nr:phage head-tail connector protein [Liquorilactobacillus ghanensis]KRM06970.1 hypothetical protein FC89_GL000279 [Liquorilactobacillus ghanensis DSM 18630]
MPTPSPPDKAGQLTKLYARLGVAADSNDAAVVSDMFDDAIQMCLDYTGRANLTAPILIQAKRLAIVMYNQQADEGEIERIEGSVTRTFETGIPASIRSSLAPYRVGKVRGFS